MVVYFSYESPSKPGVDEGFVIALPDPDWILVFLGKAEQTIEISTNCIDVNLID